MAITYTTSGSAEFTESFSLDLYAGTLTTDEEWLKGGASAAYPGNLDGFLAANDEVNPATTGLKLVCGKFTTVLADGETLTVEGEATKIVAVLVGATKVADAGVELTSISAAGVATFGVVGSPGNNVTAWLIVA